jgi:DNA-binding NtrC family response regulator
VPIEIGKAGEAGEITVIATARARVPVPPEAGPWIWMCVEPIGPELELAAVRAGAYDAIQMRTDAGMFRLVARLLELTQATPRIDAGGFIGGSQAAQRVLDEVARAATTSMPVLFTGETGTGKDIAARVLHAGSTRGKRSFVAINCAAVPNELIEAELFGYTRGAFSGAVKDYDGQLSAAAGGTVFLDEIDDTPPTLQAKLLRVLEDRVVSRLGENQWRKVDFRIVAATNRDLPTLVARGEFAEDLYQRLAIEQIHLPPLRERLEDLPALIAHFIARFYVEEPAARATVHGASPSALRALAAYPWPGNIRELRNVVYQALVAKRGGDELLVADLPRRILGPVEAPAGIDRAVIARRVAAGTFDLRALLDEVERTALAVALEHAGGSPARAARFLGTVGRGGSRDPGGTVKAMMRRLKIT